MHKRIKTEKVKKSEECNKQELKIDNNIIIMNNNNNTNNSNNDYNDSNRKEKASKVATKKT